MKKIIASPELIGAMMGHLPAKGIAQLERDPNNFMQAFGFGFGTTSDVKAVTNEEDIVNIALPYYSSMERDAGAMLSDDDLEDISGGNGGGVIRLTGNAVMAAIYEIAARPISDQAKLDAIDEFYDSLPSELFER